MFRFAEASTSSSGCCSSSNGGESGRDVSQSKKPGCSLRGATNNIYEQIVAASTGAVLTALLMTPMDVVKIRLQQQRHRITTGECFFYSNGLMDHLCRACEDQEPCEWYRRPGHFNGTLDGLLKMARSEGVRSLWSGLSPTLVMAVPATVFYYSLYDQLLDKLRSTDRQSRTVQAAAPLLAGSLARSASVTLVAPLDMLRTNLQSAQRHSLPEIWRSMRASVTRDGWRSLFLGWAPTMWRDIPFSAIYFACYEELKQRAIERTARTHTTFLISFVAGALAGLVAAILTHPFDVVKTRQQLELMHHFSAHTRPTSGKGTFRMMADITQQAGWRALFAGVSPRMVKVAPACAIMISTYEFFKLYFHNRRHINDDDTAN